MRKLIESCLISADGVVLNDPFPFQDYVDEAVLRDRIALFEACDAVLWGRTTYERFARRWQGTEARPPYVARLSAMRNYLVSSTLQAAEWNRPIVVRGDVAVEVTKLKAQEGGAILVLGHGLLGETLLEHRLLDVLELTIHPVLVGQGTAFLREGQAANLKLAATKTYSKLVKVTYEPQQ